VSSRMMIGLLLLLACLWHHGFRSVSGFKPDASVRSMLSLALNGDSRPAIPGLDLPQSRLSARDFFCNLS